jgi:glycosyltransferase involved in cell wall biosynthesis
MKKILFVTSALSYGGAGKMIAYLANAFAEFEEYNVSIYVELFPGVHYSMNPKINIIQESKHFKSYLSRHFLEIFQMRKRIKEFNPDLVISFQTNQNALAVLGTRGRHIPVIISERGDPYLLNSVFEKMKRWVISHAEGGVFQTQKAKARYGSQLQKRSVVIHNPNTVKAVTPPTWIERRDEIAFVARFDVFQKRQDIMVKAFNIVAKHNPAIKLVFYGGGEQQKQIARLVDDFGLTNRVVFKGLVKNIPDAIRESKMFLLTSDYEGLPNALIEAMACGLPCVSTDCSPGGARELIQDGVNGLIVPCGDVEAIAEKIIYLLDNPDVAEKMGYEAQKIVDRLEPSLIFGQWKSYVEEVYDKFYDKK